MKSNPGKQEELSEMVLVRVQPKMMHALDREREKHGEGLQPSRAAVARRFILEALRGRGYAL